MQREDSHRMDPWRQEDRRRKRTFEEMSQRRTRSPQPLFFGQDNSRSRSPDRRPPFFQRRRTSHPHNHPPPTPTFASPDIMASFRPHQPPNLEHRASQTVIDLTDDGDIPQLSQLSQSRPPQLHRSDRLDLGDIIDLTEDGEEDEIEITHSISVVQPPRDQSRELPRPLPVPLPQPSMIERAAAPFMALQRGGFANLVPNFHRHHHRHIVHDAIFRNHGPHDHHHHQPMPVLDYQRHPFQPIEPQRPPHEPPPAAREGFTRSPAEDDIIVCPSCDEELIATKGGHEQAAPRKSGKSKPQSKKDREEHPFWVVRACGHVYCNTCFQGRKTDKRFLPLDNPKTPTCCVDECQSDVSSKSRWVGVFL